VCTTPHDIVGRPTTGFLLVHTCVCVFVLLRNPFFACAQSSSRLCSLIQVCVESIGPLLGAMQLSMGGFVDTGNNQSSNKVQPHVCVCERVCCQGDANCVTGLLLRVQTGAAACVCCPSGALLLVVPPPGPGLIVKLQKWYRSEYHGVC